MAAKTLDEQKRPAQPRPLGDAVVADVESAVKGAEHPMLAAVGAFEDDPAWDEVMEEIRRHRRKLDRAAHAVEHSSDSVPA